METLNLVFLSCNIVIAGCALYVAHKANMHFKLRNTFDWWKQLDSEEFRKLHQVVVKLIDQNDSDSLVSRIGSDPNNSRAVAHVLNVMEQGATAARFGFLNTDLSVRHTTVLLRYYYKGLQPWGTV